MQGLQRWESSQAPFPDSFAFNDQPGSHLSTSLADFLHDLKFKRRGLIVVGEQSSMQESQACLQIAAELGWPLCADALSGKWFNSPSSSKFDRV